MQMNVDVEKGQTIYYWRQIQPLMLNVWSMIRIVFYSLLVGLCLIESDDVNKIQ